MVEELTELLNKYSENNKYADKNFIYSVIAIVSKYKGLEGIVSKVTVYDNRNSINSRLNPNEIAKFYPAKGIYINYGALAQHNLLSLLQCKETLINVVPDELLTDSFISEFLLYKYNLQTLFVILHELEHAKYFVNYNTKNTFESMILDLNLKLLARYEYYKVRLYDINNIALKNLKVNIDDSLNICEEYTKIRKSITTYNNDLASKGLWRIEPIERFANINALDAMPRIISGCDLSDEGKNALLKMNEIEKYYCTYSSSYSSDLNPLGTYMDYMDSIGELYTEKMNSEEIRNQVLRETDRLGLLGRLHYGLGITEEERNKEKNKSIKIL